MKPKIKTMILVGLITCGMSYANMPFVNAKMAAEAPPSLPPNQNPHPAKTETEHKRVQFAEEAVRLLLMATPSLNITIPIDALPTTYQNKNLSCLQSSGCYQKDKAFVYDLQHLHSSYGTLQEMKHAHIIPWSWENFQNNKKDGDTAAPTSPKVSQNMAPAMSPMMGPQCKSDEFMVHIYVKFDKSPEWQHLDVILTEDAQGNVFLRRFFVTPMRSPLPPGAVC